MSFCPVDVWTFDLDLPRAVVLTPDETIRANRFIFEKDRIHWSHARSALRTTLASYLECSPETVQLFYGLNGKPAVHQRFGLEFNISHSRDRAMIAITRAVPVGIDLEVIRESVEIAKLLRRVGETDLEGSTTDLFHRWTRREARTKALGGQLMLTPLGDLRVADLTAPEGFAASVALLGADPEPHYRQV
jgi:4'-phosphopantetheinyl transferase